MAWTYNSLLAACSEFLDGFTDISAFSTAFPICVRQAEERILHVTKGQPFRRRSTFSVAALEHIVAEVPDLMAPISLKTDAGVLQLKETNWIDEVYGAAPGSGTPAYYAIQQKLDDQAVTQVYAVPASNSLTTYTMEYYAKPASLVDVQTGTWISTNCENALFYGVLFHLYVYEKGEADLLAKYQEEFEKALSLLKGFARTWMKRDEFGSSQQPLPEG